MPKRGLGIIGLAGLVALGGCATAPAGPTVAVLPAPGKPFERFTEEDAFCREFSRSQAIGAPEQANREVIGSAIIGTLLGAGLGAAVGGGRGAAIGAAAGSVAGTGAGRNSWSEMTTQQRYNIAYMQCMYAKGNQVPGYTVAAAVP